MSDQNECVKEQCGVPITKSKLMLALMDHDFKSKESAFKDERGSGEG